MRPVTDNPAYDAAMNALHDATSEAHAWDVAWAPEAMRPRLFGMLNILGQAIIDCRAALTDKEQLLTAWRLAACPEDRLADMPQDAELIAHVCQMPQTIRDAHEQMRTLAQVLDETHLALFDRCGGVMPATADERRILDLGSRALGLFGHKGILDEIRSRARGGAA